MNFLITGGSGLIGSRLVAKLISQHKVTVLTRNPASTEKMLGAKPNYLSNLSRLTNLDEFDAVINLAGEPIVNKRWSAEQKAKIEQSRWGTTSRLAELFAASKSPPELMISGSAVGFYGRQNAQEIDETFDRPNDEYSHVLCAMWEKLALDIASDTTRVCLLRTGIVLADNGGALDKMALPFKLGLGGPIGDGEHFMSWIHINDMVDAILHLVKNSSCSGIYNLTAPNPVSNKDFSKALAKSMHRPCILFTPKFVLKLAMGEMADLLIYGQRVIPMRLHQSGFEFNFPTIEEAFADIRP